MNNGLISREALREDLRRFFPTEVLEGIDPKTLFAQIMHDIDNAPTVFAYTEDDMCQATVDGYDVAKMQFERPQGKWNYIQAGMCVCPFCGADPHKVYKNFCPNCGAKMKGGAE